MNSALIFHEIWWAQIKVTSWSHAPVRRGDTGQGYFTTNHYPPPTPGNHSCRASPLQRQWVEYGMHVYWRTKIAVVYITAKFVCIQLQIQVHNISFPHLFQHSRCSLVMHWSGAVGRLNALIASFLSRKRYNVTDCVFNFVNKFIE